MKQSHLLTLGSALLLVAAQACQKSDKYVDNSVAFNRIEYSKTYSLQKTADDFGRDADLVFGCQADMLMPTVLYGHDIATLQDTILARALGKYGPDHLALIEDQMRAAAAEFGYALADTVLPDSITVRYSLPACVDGFASVEGDVETLTPKFLSYATNKSEYTPGAAHGDFEIRYTNYDLEKGTIITLADIVTPEGIVALPEQLRQIAAAMEPTIGITEIESLPSGNNFYITASYELVFSYQPYEVASYAQGEIQIPVPAYLISQYLTPRGYELLLN